ncbi:hypothetical protein SLNWT_7203 [Streptomyces albus]|uniref:Uncharacterized protein n=1 Tax=Streptomyces albus (strain ATCC 21838 / DSM 41398 / FERM P-419 / JCM 4703 / NBRC 107858) TaxID=1081613 RepID=A0A0B5F0H1_STRA4|nr:hypothetical protein SLNWT_7203 [Streptomyces albus]AOU81881.1 hypothetical protein SLNHY_7190 [Streptomyces albus]
MEFRRRGEGDGRAEGDRESERALGQESRDGHRAHPIAFSLAQGAALLNPVGEE